MDGTLGNSVILALELAYALMCTYERARRVRTHERIGSKYVNNTGKETILTQFRAPKKEIKGVKMDAIWTWKETYLDSENSTIMLKRWKIE